MSTVEVREGGSIYIRSVESGMETIQDIPLIGNAAYPGVEHSPEAYQAYASYLRLLYPEREISVVKVEYFRREQVL